MKILKILFIAFLVIPLSVSSQVINEIMYDLPSSDSGREWIEVLNNGDQDIRLSEWKFLENGVAHKVTPHDLERSIVSVNNFAVISDDPELFLIDNPNYKGLLFESSFSLSNTGEEIGLVDSSGNTTNKITYSSSLGGKGGELSLQLLDDVLISAIPTPGEENKKEPFSEDSKEKEEDTFSDKASVHSEQINLSVKEVEEKNIEISAGRERLVSVNVPIKFQATENGYGNSRRAKFLWNFGDGKTSKGLKVEHTYKHPGTYNVVLNAISGSDRAVSRTKVNVFYPEISIETEDQGIVFNNNSEYELNIGDFEIDFGKEEYLFPKDTIISPKSHILFDWNLINLNKSSSSTFELIFPSGKKY